MTVTPSSSFVDLHDNLCFYSGRSIEEKAMLRSFVLLLLFVVPSLASAKEETLTAESGQTYISDKLPIALGPGEVHVDVPKSCGSWSNTSFFERQRICRSAVVVENRNGTLYTTGGDANEQLSYRHESVLVSLSIVSALALILLLFYKVNVKRQVLDILSSVAGAFSTVTCVSILIADPPIETARQVILIGLGVFATVLSFLSFRQSFESNLNLRVKKMIYSFIGYILAMGLCGWLIV